MNERIRELALQAGIKITPMVVDGVEYEYEDVEMDGSEDLAKFAQLIVQECIAQCEQVAEDADTMAKSTFVTDVGRMIHDGAWGGAKNCTAHIRGHFGVEE